MMQKALYLLAALFGIIMIATPALDSKQADAGGVLIADIRGPLDQRALNFLERSVRTEGVQLVVLLLDTPGIASGDPTALYSAVQSVATPVAIWVGPGGAVAYGGAAELLKIADLTSAAPGTRIGLLEPTVVRDGHQGVPVGDWLREDSRAVSDSILVGETDGGPLIDVVAPTIGQLVASLDGRTLDGVTLETAKQIDDSDGKQVTVPSVNVVFDKPGLFDRFLRLATRPEAAFFFLMAGLAVATFEFYAAGAGFAAMLGAVSLLLAGYGWSVLPINWIGVASALFGLAMYTWDFQRNELGPRSVLGTLALVFGGFNYTSGAPQFGSPWWAVALTVMGTALFYAFALTTVVRSRFSTLTIGREHLVGQRGVAETDFDPEGVIVLESGARWRARSHRAAGLGVDDQVEVLEISGTVLEVGPID